MTDFIDLGEEEATLLRDARIKTGPLLAARTRSKATAVTPGSTSAARPAPPPQGSEGRPFIDLTLDESLIDPRLVSQTPEARSTAPQQESEWITMPPQQESELGTVPAPQEFEQRPVAPPRQFSRRLAPKSQQLEQRQAPPPRQFLRRLAPNPQQLEQMEQRRAPPQEKPKRKRPPPYQVPDEQSDFNAEIGESLLDTRPVSKWGDDPFSALPFDPHRPNPDDTLAQKEQEWGGTLLDFFPHWEWQYPEPPSPSPYTSVLPPFPHLRPDLGRPRKQGREEEQRRPR